MGIGASWAGMEVAHVSKPPGPHDEGPSPTASVRPKEWQEGR